MTTLSWSYHTWTVRPYSSSQGPGPNAWNDTAENASVQSNGDLRLGIIPVTSGGVTQWQCTEIDGPALGYGQYTFELGSDTTDWYPSLVLGLFVYDDSAPPNYREIDFAEISKWGNAAERSRAWFTLQPTSETNQSSCLIYRQMPQRVTATWQSGQVYFEAFDGYNRLLGEHLVTSGVPTAGNATVRINFWLDDPANPPPGGTRQFVVLKPFYYYSGRTYTQPVASTKTVTFGQDTSPAGFALYGDTYLSDYCTGLTYGSLVLPCRNDKSYAFTGSVWNLQGSSVDTRIPEVPPVGNGSNESRYQLRYDSSNYFQMGTLNGNLVSKMCQAGTITSSSTTYSSTSHAYWRIRESSGTIYFDTSPDRSTWTNQWSTSHSFGSKLNTMRVRYECEHNSAQGDPGQMVVYAINTSG